MTLAAKKEESANFVTTHTHRGMFTSASDFGFVVSPIALGVFAEAYRIGSPALAILFVAGVGFALRLLSHLHKLETWEAKL